MKDTPLPAVGETFRVEGVNYIIAAGYGPAGWANTSAKLVLVNFDTRTFLQVCIRQDKNRAWRFGSVLIRRKG